MLKGKSERPSPSEINSVDEPFWSGVSDFGVERWTLGVPDPVILAPPHLFGGMMFLPVGHDQSSVRRLPWVTFSIMGLCVLAFFATLVLINSANEDAARLLNEIAKYYFAHPHTELEPEIEENLLGFIPEHQGQREAFQEVLKEGVTGFGLVPGAEDQGPVETEAEQQAKLDRLTFEFYQTIKSSPYYTFGLVPADQHLYAYITHQFMHGGWMHLVFNLLFLYLAGPYLEDVWGRPLFGGFYLAAGVVAALVYVMKYPALDVPMVGASGAIAGLMGAFLVRHGGTKIKMMVWVFIFRPRFFDAPAWLMLPVWLLREVFHGQAVDFGGGQGSGVAHWAHVAGFVFGLVVAAGVKQMKFEEKYVEKALEAQSDQHENLDLEEALAARQGGDLEKADRILLSQLKDNPGDFDAAMAYWDVRRDIGDVAPAVPFVLRVFRDAARKGQHELIAPPWPEVVEMAPEGSIDPALAAKVVETVGGELGESVCRATVDAGAAGVTSATTVGVLARLTRVGAAVGASSARVLAEQALAAPDLPEETRAEIEGILAGSMEEDAPPPETAAAVSEGEQEETVRTLAPEDHQLEIMEGVPTSWDNGVLTLEIGGQTRPMNLDQIQAIAVGGIVESGRTPFVVVDLMLDGPWSKRVKLRVVRLRSTAFDPASMAEGPDPMSCFKRLLVDMLAVSEAVPLPDPDSAVGSPFQRFAGIPEYELAVIGVRVDPLA